MNGADFTVVGVAGRDFGGASPGFQVQLWFPIRSLEQVLPQDGSLLAMDDRFLNVVGRLEPGATLAGLRPRLDAATVGLADVDGFPPDRGFVTSTALGVHPALRGLVTRVVTVLLAVALLVFAVSCANVANLSLSRGIRRTPEIATRLALGASNGRVVARLLHESVLLGRLGWGPAGVVTAAAAAAVSSARLPVGVPLALDVPVDGRVLGLGAATGLAAACLFGIVPAIRTLTCARRATLGASFAAADAVGRSMLRSVLMAVQVGTACLLLIAASILLKSVRNLATLDPGFDRHRIVTVGASLEAHEEGEGRRFQETLLVHYSLVGPRYLDVLGIGLVSGRGFDPGGAEAGTAIVNQALADLLWPERDPLGRTPGYALRGEEGSALVVGVTETVKYRRFNESSTPFLYLPAARWYRPDLVIHARGRVPGCQPGRPHESSPIVC